MRQIDYDETLKKLISFIREKVDEAELRVL